MDDTSAFERQVSAELSALMGPVRPVDDAAILRVVTARRSPVWRFRTLSSGMRLVVAAAIVALFGGFLLAALLPRAEDVAPAASAVSVDPPRLAYALDGDIYVGHEDGTDAVRILDGDPTAQCGGYGGGKVSPDGRYLAVRSGGDDDCPGTVTILELDGRLLATVPGEGRDIGWAPDSTRIATWISLWETIGVYGIDGTLHAQLAPLLSSSGGHDPKWSPDGTALLHLGMSRVWRLPLDGSQQEVLPATDPLASASVSFSPDGTRIASEGPDGDLVVAALGGPPEAVEFSFGPGDQVAGDWEDGPVWSPDGDRVAVAISRGSTDAAGDVVQRSVSLWVVDLATEVETLVATREGALLPIAFSPEGDRLLIEVFGADFEKSFWTVAGHGVGTTTIVPGSDVYGWVPPPLSALE